MGQVLVRNIDDEVVAVLKVKARLAGVSFETFLREQLTAIAPLSGDERVALLGEFHRKHGPVVVRTPPDVIVQGAREDRLDGIGDAFP